MNENTNETGTLLDEIPINTDESVQKPAAEEPAAEKSVVQKSKKPMDEKERKRQEWKAREIGVLWRKGDGLKKFFSGFVIIGDIRVELVVFRNKRKQFGLQDGKDVSKYPDLVIYRSDRDKNSPSVFDTGTELD